MKKNYILIILLSAFFFSAQATSFTVSVLPINYNCTFVFTTPAIYKAVVTGGVGPFNYEWFNEIGFSIQNSVYDTCQINYASAGNQFIRVTDLSDSTVVDQYFYWGQDFTLLSDLVTDPSPCGNGCDGMIFLNFQDNTGSGFPFPGDITWSTGASFTNAVFNLCPGNYSVTYNHANATCPYPMTFGYVVNPQSTNPPQLSLTSVDPSCGANNGSASANVTGGTAPIQYLWSNSATTQTNSNLTAGVYTVTIYDANNCSVSAMVLLNSASGITATGIITEVSCNGLADGSIAINATSASGIQSYLWNTIPQQTTATATGLGGGTYTVIVTDTIGCVWQQSYSVTNPASLSVYLNQSNYCLYELAGAQQAGGTAPYFFLWSDGTTTGINHITTSGIYTVTVTDANGCTVSGMCTILLPLINDVYGNIYEDVNGNCVKDGGEQSMSGAIVQAQPGNYFATTDVNGNYHIQTGVANYTLSTVLLFPYFNQSCTSVYAANFSTPCNVISNNDFTGSFVPNVNDLKIDLTSSVARPGLGMAYYITYTNVGTNALSGTINFIHDTLTAMNFSMPAYDTYNIPQADFIFSNLQPRESRSITIYMWIALPQNGATLGDSLFSYATINPLAGDSMPVNNTSHCYSVLTASYDPNEKTVSPGGMLIDFDSMLTYTVYFQNTGTDTAFTVSIMDTLSDNLDLTSFQLLGYSHPLTWELSNGNALHFYFNNVMLPDSNTNEIASHGFVKYGIKPKANLPDNSLITNTAYIYFDFNNPVITNTVSNTIFSTVSITTIDKQHNVAVFPNPSQRDVTFKISGYDRQIFDLKIYDVTGKVISSKIIKQEQAIKRNELKSGIYFYRITDSTQTNIASGKFVME